MQILKPGWVSKERGTETQVFLKYRGRNPGPRDNLKQKLLELSASFGQLFILNFHPVFHLLPDA